MQKKLCNQIQLFAIGLKSQRKQRKLTQKELADLVGVKKKTQIKYEKGRKFPCMEYLFRLYIMGFNLIELGFADVFLNPQEQAIIDLYRKSSQKNKRKILQILLNDFAQEQSKPHNHNAATIVGKQAIATKKSKKSKIIKTVIYLET